MSRSHPDPPPRPDAEGPLRLFIALPATPEVVRRAQETISRLRGAGDVRWVAPDRLHLTLKFLGDTPAGKLPEIIAGIAAKANTFSRFMVELGGAGAFPNLRRPQTLWLGFAGRGAETLTALAAAVDEAAHAAGWPREKRPFQPHLTLGRVRSSRELRELAERLRREGEAATASVEWPVEELHLVRSVLRPQGPEYTVLERFPLREEESPAPRFE
ncbi:MAG: RNA 2',3'-cyclic phosphodiesterase [Armatimonadota bacterium]